MAVMPTLTVPVVIQLRIDPAELPFDLDAHDSDHARGQCECRCLGFVEELLADEPLLVRESA